MWLTLSICSLVMLVFITQSINQQQHHTFIHEQSTDNTQVIPRTATSSLHPEQSNTCISSWYLCEASTRINKILCSAALSLSCIIFFGMSQWLNQSINTTNWIHKPSTGSPLTVHNLWPRSWRYITCWIVFVDNPHFELYCNYSQTCLKWTLKG